MRHGRRPGAESFLHRTGLPLSARRAPLSVVTFRQYGYLCMPLAVLRTEPPSMRKLTFSLRVPRSALRFWRAIFFLFSRLSVPRRLSGCSGCSTSTICAFCRRLCPVLRRRGAGKGGRPGRESRQGVAGAGRHPGAGHLRRGPRIVGCLVPRNAEAGKKDARPRRREPEQGRPHRVADRCRKGALAERRGGFPARRPVN